MISSQDDVSVFGEPLGAVHAWMQHYLSETEALEAHWFELYLDHREFWDILPDIVHALVDRRWVIVGA